MRWLRRLLKGKRPRQSNVLGPWALVEDYGGIGEPIVYGEYKAVRAIQADIEDIRDIKMHAVCRVCDEIDMDCNCNRGDFK